jgi:hypothetical protein
LGAKKKELFFIMRFVVSFAVLATIAMCAPSVHLEPASDLTGWTVVGPAPQDSKIKK